jgi:hypothetical protein
MIPSDHTKTDEHPTDLLPMYVDDGLSTVERRLVENHIRECAPCSEEVESLRLVINILRKEKTVFCPEPWELYEFIEQGTDPTGKIAQHLQGCPLCCADVAHYNERSATKRLPDKIRNELRKGFPKQGHSEKFERKTWFVWAPAWLSSFFKTPALVLGTVVATTILVVVFFYPNGTPPAFIGVSSDNWEENGPQGTPKSLFSNAHARKEIDKPAPSGSRGAARPLFVDGTKPRVATIIVFHGFNKPEHQSTVDYLYQALKPSPEIEKKFKFLTPVQLKDFLEKTSDRKLSPTQALSQFYKEFSVNLALIVNVKLNKEKFGLTTEVVDTLTGQILAEFTRDTVTKADLPSAVGKSLELLNMIKSNSQVR